MAKRKKPRHREQPPKSPAARKRHDPESTESEKLVWALSAVDREGPWGWRKVTAKAWWDDIFPVLYGLETMTWAEVKSAAGGRRQGTNHHAVPVGEMTREARKRLDKIEKDDLDEMFSLRIDSRKRIYGIREGRVFKPVWYDPFHGENKNAVFPVSQRNS